MAATFGGADYYSTASGPGITAFPFTIACRFNPNSFSGFLSLWGFCNSSGSNNYARLLARNTSTSGTLNLQVDNSGDSGGGGALLPCSGTVAVGTWYSAIGTCNGPAQATDWDIFLNGTGRGTALSSLCTGFPTAINTTQIGVGINNNGPFNGSIAECALWNVILTAAERAMYDAGVSPLLINPNALTFYAPCIRGIPIDVIAALRLSTTTGTPTNSPGPALIYPHRRIARRFDVTVAPPPILLVTSPLRW